jgi:uncharacterized protein YdcH (DUF465 family)
MNPQGGIAMERPSPEELKSQLMENNEEFRRLALAHAEYARKIEALEALPYLSEEQQLEETKLKKLKLHAKDMMAAILNRHRTEAV